MKMACLQTPALLAPSSGILGTGLNLHVHISWLLFPLFLGWNTTVTQGQRMFLCLEVGLRKPKLAQTCSVAQDGLDFLILLLCFSLLVVITDVHHHT